MKPYRDLWLVPIGELFLVPRKTLYMWICFTGLHLHKGLYLQQRILSRGSIQNLSTFSGCKQEPTLEVLQRTLSYSISSIKNPTRRFYHEPIYIPRVSSNSTRSFSRELFYPHIKPFCISGSYNCTFLWKLVSYDCNLSPGLCGSLLPLRYRSMGRAASESRSGC